jgi:hypothetical protein
MIHRTILSRPQLGRGAPFERFALGAIPAVVSSRFTLGSTGWLQTNVTDAGLLELQLPLALIGEKISQVTLRVAGGGSHVGLPATLPTLLFVKNLGGLATLLGSAADPSTTVAEYESPHDLVIPDINLVLRPTDFDFLQIVVTGEAGANALINFHPISFTL